jgi:cytochrome c oxidase subunit 2
MRWLPPNGALHGFALDRLLRWNLDVVFWLFIASQVLLVIALVWGRRAAAADTPVHSRSLATRLLTEWLPLLAIAALYGWMLVTGHQLWAARREAPPAPETVRVEVTGVQFQWYFRYPGADGEYGAVRPELINAPQGNPLGIDPGDAHGADDVVSSILMLPAGHAVDLTLRSQDVIHGLFIPGMRLKQDAIPGMIGHLEFTPTVPGTYSILCSQVCGLGHARMQAILRVVADADYDRWMAARERAALEAHTAPSETAR